MTQEQLSERAMSQPAMEPGEVIERRREHKNPASEVRCLLIAAARALPAGLPLWVAKSPSERAR